MRILALSILFAALLATNGSAHPVHVSVTNMDMKPDSACIDFSIRLFYDDFQMLINHSYDTELDFASRNLLTSGEQEAILDYLGKSFQLITDQEEVLVAEYLGWKKEDQSVSFLFRVYIGTELEGLNIRNTLMLDLFEDQSNLVIMKGRKNQSGWEFSKRNIIQAVRF